MLCGHACCIHTQPNTHTHLQVGMLPVISDIVEESLMRWLRAAELTCDRAALLVAQDRKVKRMEI